MKQLLQYLSDEEVNQSDFGKQCGITQATVSRLVSGKAQPSANLAKKIEEITSGAVSRFDWPAFEPLAPDEMPC